ncbi:hypothetical protein IFM89_039871 [Coptis chinensis]|uniref:Myosin motor domain-containing protein n=1 Tax=Coptis chinensis TaxID=261450 RepID=A0A835LGX0_9MAGN|nr:hypothetical protein IFM89_039871 [Coptis chinensis]
MAYGDPNFHQAFTVEALTQNMRCFGPVADVQRTTSHNEFGPACKEDKLLKHNNLITIFHRVGRFQLRSSGKHIQILTSSGKKMFVLADKLYTRDANVDHAGVDDMTKLPYLNEPEVLFNLARRYALNDIYVSLIALVSLSF